MTTKINELKGIDPMHVTKLRDAKIENVEALLKVWEDPAKREELMKSTGIGEQEFARIMSIARLSRMNGMTPERVDLLMAAGIDGPKKLFTYSPEALAKHLGEVAATRKMATPMPTSKDVAGWFADAKADFAGAN